MSKKIFGMVLLFSVLFISLFTSLTQASTVKASAQLTLSPNSGYIGDCITISGSGFKSNSLVTITVSTIEALKFEIATDNKGSFSGKVTIPDDGSLTGGIYDVVAKDTKGTEAHAPFTLLPYIILTPSCGPAAITVTVVCKGFSSESIIGKLSATFDGEPVTLKYPDTFSSENNFVVYFTVPDVPPGSYKVTVMYAGDPMICSSATFIVTMLCVTPENPLGALLPLFACIVTLVLFKKRYNKKIESRFF